MAKKGNHRLIMPPRYFRNDPRNKAREAAGQVLGRQLQGYDLPVRKLRKRDGSNVLTIPPEVCELMGVVGGDEIMFSKTFGTGVVVIAGIKRPGDPAGCRQGG
ncbi:hypothetical protein ES705_15946 [subsurface metagenome]